MLRVVIVVLLVAIGSAGAAERTGLLAPRALHAKRATSPIAIDGTLDEPAWDGAEPAEHLIQTRPRPGEESPLHTTARVVFDDDALYVGVRLDDPHAELIQAPLGRRDDETTSDWCFVEIDSRHDHRSAFSFGVNAAGMQVDGVFVDDVTYDSSWNAVWQVAATRDAHGWTAEYRIPFSVFAFSRPKPGTPMVWGLNIYRSNPASGESANWSPRIPQLAGVVSLFNDLVIDAAPSPRRIDLAPYGLASTRDGLRGGLDLDVALGSNLAMVATVLPDFGQVDADPAQLNLTAFELFLPERRPFFTEGLDAFRFDTSLPLVSRGDSFADEAPFYTRRIGRVVDGVATPILGAVKLYGRTDDGWRAGVLAAATREVDADGAPIAAPEQAAIARVIKEGGDGEHAVGLLATGLHRSGELGLPRDEGVAGLDARVRFAEQTYELRGFALASADHGRADAIATLATAPWHLLGRVDAPRLHLAPGATDLSGLETGASFAKVGGDLFGAIAVRAITPGFDDNSLGFQRNSDWIGVVANWGRQWFPNARWIQRWHVGSGNTGIGWSFGGERRAAVVDAEIGATFANYWDATLNVQHEAAVVSTEWLRGGPALGLPAKDTAKLSLHTNTNRVTYAGLDLTASREATSGSRDLAIAPSLVWRIGDHLAGTATLAYDDQIVGWQYIATSEPWVVARDHQRTASLAVQLDVPMTPRLIAQLYAQPFVTTGAYDRYQTVVDAPHDRFGPVTAWTFMKPDGTYRSSIASALVRWELHPGSFLTAVWQHHGEITDQRAFASSLGPALHVAGSDVVLVKLAWLFQL